jgi:hypothetical protein
MNADNLKQLLLSEDWVNVKTGIQINKGLNIFDLKTFDDLEFKLHPNSKYALEQLKRDDLSNGLRAMHTRDSKAIQARMELKKCKLSVVGGSTGLYGDGVNDFEAWFMSEDNPYGYQTKEQITINMVRAQLEAALIEF